eukprot:IDg1752t1
MPPSSANYLGGERRAEAHGEIR